jgi:hypothetical protein
MAGMASPSDPGRAAGSAVRFFERAGPDARAVLERLGRDLVAAGAGVELLASEEREDLWLLVARGGATAPPLDTHTRCWRFRTADA